MGVKTKDMSGLSEEICMFQGKLWNSFKLFSFLDVMIYKAINTINYGKI